MTTPASWVSKAPADMTLEELQEAKATVQAATDTAQQEFAWRHQANSLLAAEILTRFTMENQPGYIAPQSLGTYPAEQVAATFGG